MSQDYGINNLKCERSKSQERFPYDTGLIYLWPKPSSVNTTKIKEVFFRAHANSLKQRARNVHNQMNRLTMKDGSMT